MKSQSLLSKIIAVIVFAALIAATAVIHLDLMSTPPAHAPEKTPVLADRDKLFDLLSGESIAATYKQIASFGSRAPGQQGLEDTRNFIAETFRKEGLEVIEQAVDVPYPLLAKDSGYISNGNFRTAAMPFRPNYAQPVSTGANGIDGELFIANKETIRAAKDLSDKIAVIDTAMPIFDDFGLNPARYADLGFKAVVLTSSKGIEQIPWNGIASKMILPRLPVNIVRLVCAPDILDHIGETVHIDARSVWNNAHTHNVVGILRAPVKVDKAMLVIVQYDATSMLPDVAHGSLEAFETATMLQTCRALSAVRETLKRDVIFIATTGLSQTQSGINKLISTIGVNGKRGYAATRIAEEIADNDEKSAMLKDILALFDNPNFACPGHATETAESIRALSPETLKFMNERFSAAMRKSVFDQSEKLLQAKIAYGRDPDDLTRPEYYIFRAEKKRYDDLNNLSGLPIAQALERPVAKLTVFSAPNGTRVSLRDALRLSIEHLLAWHATRANDLASDLALQKLFAPYDELLGFSGRFSPASSNENGEKLGFAGGRGLSRGEGFDIFQTIVNEAVYNLGLTKDVQVVKGAWDAFGSFFSEELCTKAMGIASYPSFSLVSAKEKAKNSNYPFEQPEFENTESFANSLKVYAEVLAMLANGRGSFPRLPAWGPLAVRGAVYASGVGNSVVPNYAVEGALVCCDGPKANFMTNPYGEYDEPFMLVPAFGGERWQRYDAFLFNEHGEVIYAKDYGDAAQLIFASSRLNYNYQPMNHILFRSTPVALLNSVNPQSLKAFTGFSFVATHGLAGFASNCKYTTEEGLMDYLPPDERFFLLLKAGAAHNELVSVTRAFCLGATHTNDPAYKPSGNEIDGPGYLACDTRIFPDVTSEAISSMAWLADKRLDLQKQYDMSDEMTETFAARAAEISTEDQVNGPDKPVLERQRSLRQALSYLILNHPVIRESISEAVWGILWYLGLLVPFIFFFEKLVFGFTDIRKQILAESAIFLVVFALLRILHPAFHMIRSSAMILLGFVIILVVGSVTAVLSGKFKESFDALRRSQGAVAGAEGNKSGIVLTAFMLGLNNMHRRKVRTGLTCATLVLMTFVMVCFTSVQSNVVESERAVGRANYQGLVTRKEQYAPMSVAEIDALKSAFGEQHAISKRNFYVGYYDSGTQSLRSPEFKVEIGEGDNSRLETARAALGFDSTEPLGKVINLLCTNGWFTLEQQRQAKEPYPLIISDVMAEKLGVTTNMVNAGPVPASVNGTRYFILNIFDSMSLAATTDADGRTLLPFDAEALANTRLAPGGLLIADETDAQVDAADVILGINDQLSTDSRGTRTVSAVVDMGNVPYTTARREIFLYLEQSGNEGYYSLDGTSFSGRRARTRTAAGLIDLLIPLIIAALTVLNTMKGSVYERRNEIYVYNAVGIAPKYIFFMFVAEALVYSVVGAVLGYVLSQGVGRILTAMHLTGGVSMNFTSVTCIYASIAIAVATLLSTWFPARAAMEIAKPADNAGWSLPEPDANDRITLYLPFTFTHYDRIAVLAFFHKYFDGFGEGSAGQFFASEPKLKLATHTDDLADGAYIPALEVQVWLKPFDLGVSQLLEIELGTDPDTHEYIAKMILTRVTGTRDSWVRLNTPFVTAVRRQFLHWRAVGKDQKAELFAEAKELLVSAKHNA